MSDRCPNCLMEAGHWSRCPKNLDEAFLIGENERLREENEFLKDELESVRIQLEASRRPNTLSMGGEWLVW